MKLNKMSKKVGGGQFIAILPGGGAMSGRLARAVPLVAALAFAPSALSAEYQFIVSGYPAENKSYSAASSGTSLVTAARTARSGVSPMEARYRTWDESNTSTLRSDKRYGFLILFR